MPRPLSLFLTFDVEQWVTLAVINPGEQRLCLPGLHGVLDRDDVLLSLDHPLGQVGDGEPDPFDVVPDSCRTNHVGYWIDMGLFSI